MTLFLRLLADSNKEQALSESCSQFRLGRSGSSQFEVLPEAFDAVPGKPFAYWVSQQVRGTFRSFSRFESNGRAVRQGLATADDSRFVRCWWEVTKDDEKWPGFAKGGKFSPFYSDIHLVVNWEGNGNQIKNNLNEAGGVRSNVWMLRDTAINFFRQPGLTWPSRARRFAPQALPRNCLFSQRGYLAHFQDGDQDVGLAIFNSSAFDYLFKTTLGRFGYPEFLVGILQLMPWAVADEGTSRKLKYLARRAWSLSRSLDTANEVSHAFCLPEALRISRGGFDSNSIRSELARIQLEIDTTVFDLYEFTETDRAAVIVQESAILTSESDEASDLDDEGDEIDDATDLTDGLLSWAIGVAFGRFDWRLANYERDVPPEPDPFDALPEKSPGMLPDELSPFHGHSGLLVDDAGHPHDLPHLVEEVLTRVNASVPDDVRRWLQREFFPFHLQLYSKSRRKAPIYWPLSTPSGSYTLWLYYPELSSQTLYTAVNDFLEPKLKSIGEQVGALRAKGAARSRDDEKRFESLQSLELELIELRDTLLKIAPTYKPNHDDGVQITAAPLWPLFRHKPWQKVLKETWAKLERGDYDWAHLAMNYWPARVREKCKTDRSLAIAHDLESLYVEPVVAPKKAHGRKKGGPDE